MGADVSTVLCTGAVPVWKLDCGDTGGLSFVRGGGRVSHLLLTLDLITVIVFDGR